MTAAFSPAKKTVTVLIAGDTTWGEHKQDLGDHSIIKDFGYDHSSEYIRPFVEAADFGVLNLETPLCKGIKSPLEGLKTSRSYGSPDQVPQALKRLKIAGVALANNHTYDYGPEGLAQTLSALRLAGIQPFGAGMNRDEAREYFHKTVKIGKQDVEFIMISSYWERKIYKERYDWYAGKTSAGVERHSIERTAHRIQEIKGKYPYSFVIVFPHAGTNYKWKNEEQQEMAYSALDAGADMYIGHGAHMMQEIEFYHNKWIIYNLGNFIFNSRGRYKGDDLHSYGALAMLELSLGKQKVDAAVKLYPLNSNNYETMYRPKPVNNEQYRKLLNMLKQRMGDRPFTERIGTGKDELGQYFLLSPVK
jgi:poly-gamma-glutamate capsule biosynthesis protein CapA/YwtB (metallophosphatase superfamily)